MTAPDLAGRGAIDLYLRHSHAEVVERHGTWSQRSMRIESGAALRRRAADGRLAHQAWAQAPAEGPLDPPQDPAPLAAAAAGPAIARIHSLRVRTQILRPHEEPLDETRALVSVHLAVAGPHGLIERWRLGQTLAVAEVASDAEALATALRLARHARGQRPAEGVLFLPGPVAASMLARLWLHRRRDGRAIALAPAPAALAVTLLDDARPGGGPLGTAFDDEGTTTRRLELAGPGGSFVVSLPSRRDSYTDPPRAAPYNLRLESAAAAPATEADAETAGFRAAAVEAALPEARPGFVHFLLLGEDGAGAVRTSLTTDLPGFLAAVAAVPGAPSWTGAEGAVGAPDLIGRFPP